MTSPIRCAAAQDSPLAFTKATKALDWCWFCMIGWDDDDCPCDLVFSYKDQACVVPCIPFDQSPAQLHTLYVTLIVFSWLSFLCGWFYCITALFRKEMRQYPLSSTFTLQFVLSSTSIGLIFTGNLGLPYSLCESEVEFAGQGKWICWFIGFMGLVAAVAGIHAWTAFNISIILTLAKIRQKGRNWARWLVLAFCVIPTIIAVSVLMGTDSIHASPGNFSCLVVPRIEDSLSDPIVWIFWIGPLIFWFVFNVLLMVVILSYLFKSAFQAGIPILRLLRQQVRLFLFYLWFISGVGLSIFNTIYGLDKAGDWKNNLEEYLLCVNTNLLYGFITPDADSCAPCELGRTHLPFGLVFCQLLLNSTLGFVCFLLLGFRKDLFKWWWEYLSLAWRKKKFFVMEEIEEARGQKSQADTMSSEKSFNHVKVQSASDL